MSRQDLLERVRDRLASSGTALEPSEVYSLAKQDFLDALGAVDPGHRRHAGHPLDKPHVVVPLVADFERFEATGDRVFGVWLQHLTIDHVLAI